MPDAGLLVVGGDENHSACAGGTRGGTPLFLPPRAEEAFGEEHEYRNGHGGRDRQAQCADQPDHHDVGLSPANSRARRPALLPTSWFARTAAWPRWPIAVKVSGVAASAAAMASTKAG